MEKHPLSFSGCCLCVSLFPDLSASVFTPCVVYERSGPPVHQLLEEQWVTCSSVSVPNELSPLLSPAALAIGRGGVLAPGVPCDPDAVLQIPVPQRPGPGLHVDEP